MMIPFFSHHSCSFWHINSGQLSVRKNIGFPLSATNCCSARTTRCPGSEVSTSMRRDSRLKSSMIFNKRNFRPSVRLSLIKSRLKVWLGVVGITKGFFTRSGSRFFALHLILRFIDLYTRLTLLWFQLFPRLRSL